MTYACCRHCVPDHPSHPGTDQHDTPCGPLWCREGSAVVEPDLFTEATT